MYAVYITLLLILFYYHLYNCYIENRYGLDGPGFESPWRQDFPHPSRLALWPTQPPIQWVPGLSWGVKLRGRGFDRPPPSSAEVEGRVELYIYSPLWAFVDRSRGNLCLFYSCYDKEVFNFFNYMSPQKYLPTFRRDVYLHLKGAGTTAWINVKCLKLFLVSQSCLGLVGSESARGPLSLPVTEDVSFPHLQHVTPQRNMFPPDLDTSLYCRHDRRLNTAAHAVCYSLVSICRFSGENIDYVVFSAP